MKQSSITNYKGRKQERDIESNKVVNVRKTMPVKFNDLKEYTGIMTDTELMRFAITFAYRKLIETK